MLSRILGKTAGLLGFWDDNKDKEFLLPNGIKSLGRNVSYISTSNSFD
jgi:hypothetical protein